MLKETLCEIQTHSGFLKPFDLKAYNELMELLAKCRNMSPENVCTDCNCKFIQPLISETAPLNLLYININWLHKFDKLGIDAKKPLYRLHDAVTLFLASNTSTICTEYRKENEVRGRLLMTHLDERLHCEVGDLEDPYRLANLRELVEALDAPTEKAMKSKEQALSIIDEMLEFAI